MQISNPVRTSAATGKLWDCLVGYAAEFVAGGTMSRMDERTMAALWYVEGECPCSRITARTRYSSRSLHKIDKWTLKLKHRMVSVHNPSHAGRDGHNVRRLCHSC